MTRDQLRQARRVIRNHYDLKREPTTKEVEGEIAMLKRRGLGNLDDRQHRLASALQIGQHPIELFCTISSVKPEPFNYTEWLEEVEQKAIAVNQRRFSAINSSTPNDIKILKTQEAYAYLRLFMRFVSINRQLLFSVQAKRAIAAALGRKGGQATTPAKTEASRTNGKKGGRPAHDFSAFD